MASNPVIKGIELGDMDNMYTMYTSPKKPDPPEGFIDNTVYRYRLKPDGTKEFIGTMPPFPEGWDDPAKRKMTRNLRQQKNIEEEEGMRAVSLDKEKMVAKARELMSQGRSMNKAAQELGVPIGTLAYWLKKDKEQTPEPEPAAAANQEPIQGSQEPANQSVAQEKPEITVKDVLMCEAAQREQGFGTEDEEPIPYRVVGKYEALGESIGALVDQKNKQYGDAFNRSGSILEVLYPDGIRPEQYRDMLGVIRVVDKLFRIANGKQGSEDPWQDIAGYGLLGTGGRWRSV